MWPNSSVPGGVSEYTRTTSRDTAGRAWASAGPSMRPVEEPPASVLIMQMQQIVHRLEALEQHMAKIVQQMEARNGSK